VERQGAEVWFEVKPFFTRRWPSGSSRLVLLVGGISFGVRRAASEKYRRKLALLKHSKHAIEREPCTHRKDIHDDIGAG